MVAIMTFTNPATAATPLATGELKELTFRGIYEHAITLKGGLYEGEPFVPGGASRPRVRLVERLTVIGDLDGDGTKEAAVVLTENSGGSGEFTFLAVVSWRDGKAENTATRRIGDRIGLRSLQFSDGALVMEFVTAGIDESVCCPSFLTRNTYRLTGTKLVEIHSENLGQLALAYLVGTAWRLTHLARSEPVPQGVDISAVFQASKISGSAGCNRYFAGLHGDGPRELTIDHAGSTRMMCSPAVMQVESRFLTALSNVNGFGFMLGQLVLNYQDGANVNALLFSPSEGHD